MFAPEKGVKMIGIYKITNKINGKSYIGQSNDIERRFQEHRNLQRISRCGIHAPLVKYGLENFTFEVIEECSIEQLNDREKYWIKKLKTYPLGYNLTPGGDQGSVGEWNGRSRLTEEDVKNIRLAYKNKKRRKEVYQDYKDKITFSTFASVWDGTTWKHILPEVYTKELKEYYSKGTTLGENSSSSIFTDEEVLELRKRYVNETAKEIYQDVSDRCTFQTLQQLMWGRVYKHLPIYKKKEKRWVHPNE